MKQGWDLNAVLEHLKKHSPTVAGPFNVYSCERDPHHGPGNGPHGLSGPLLFYQYVEGLKKAYEALDRERVVKPKTPISVFVFHIPLAALPANPQMRYGWPFISLDPDEPYIALPSRTTDTLESAVADRARVSAAHEVTHLFDLATKHMILPDPGWKALDEATAIFMERRVFNGAHTTLDYSSDWIDNPENSLFDVNLPHPTWMFLEHVSRSHGRPSFVADLWNSQRGPTVFETISSILGEPFAATFARYATESYFTARHFPVDEYPQMHLLHERGRASRHSHSKWEATPFEQEDTLRRLGCRYYLFRIAGGGNIRFSVESGKKEHLAACATACDGNGHPGQSMKLELGEAALECLMTEKCTEACDHIVVSVANCITEENTKKSPKEIRYVLRASRA